MAGESSDKRFIITSCSCCALRQTWASNCGVLANQEENGSSGKSTRSLCCILTKVTNSSQVDSKAFRLSGSSQTVTFMFSHLPLVAPSAQAPYQVWRGSPLLALLFLLLWCCASLFLTCVHSFLRLLQS